MTSPIAVLAITDFGTNWGKGLGIASVGREAPVLASKSAFSFLGRPACPGTNGSSNWYCSRGRRQGTKHTRGTQAGDKRELKKGYRGLIESRLGKGLTGICRSLNG